jgi:hypothetical protein
MSDVNQSPPPPPPPVAGPPLGVQPQKSALGVVALVLGILSLCGFFVLSVAAIICGVIGRKKAKQAGDSTAMATAGLVLGIATGILYLVLGVMLVLTFAFGINTVFKTLSAQAQVAQELTNAKTAAEAYGLTNGSYSDLTTASLAQFGFTTSPGFTVNAVSIGHGYAFCVDGQLNEDSKSEIHMPALPGDQQVSLTIDKKTYQYALGACPAQ